MILDVAAAQLEHARHRSIHIVHVGVEMKTAATGRGIRDGLYGDRDPALVLRLQPCEEWWNAVGDLDSQQITPETDQAIVMAGVDHYGRHYGGLRHQGSSLTI